MIAAEQLAFPVVAVGARGYAHLSRTPDALQQCSSTALKNRFFARLTVVDRSGRLFDAVEAGPPRAVFE